ncbi:MAG: hypothetical protein AB7U61_13685 [Methylocystis sp.]
MAFAWDRPPCVPCREGNKAARPLHEVIGRAVSNWEGVEVASLVLFKSLVSDDARVDRYAKTFKTSKRARQLTEAVDRCKLLGPMLTREAHELITAYQGWSERRNDAAHGYVTPMWSPDYSKDDAPIVKTFSLRPSHTNPSKWRNAEPIYNLNASEVRAFANGFALLGEQFESLAARISAIKGIAPT